MPVRSAASGIDGWHLDITGRTEVTKQMITLENETKPLTTQRSQFVHGHLRRFAFFDPVTAGRRTIQAAKDVHQGRLAGARGANDGHHLAGLDVEIDVFEHLHHLVARRESAGYTTYADQRFRHDARYRFAAAN